MMRELDYKESWVLKNWYFWTVVLEKTLESLLDCKEIQPVHPKGNQSSWIFFVRIDVEDETPILWPPDANWLIGKYPDAGKYLQQEENGVTEPEMVGWHHQLNEHEFEETGKWRTGKPGVLQSMEVQIAGHNLVTKQQGLSPNLKSTVSNKYEAKSSKYLNDNFTSLECSIISWLYGCYCYLLAVTSSSCNPVDDM